MKTKILFLSMMLLAAQRLTPPTFYLPSTPQTVTRGVISPADAAGPEDQVG